MRDPQVMARVKEILAALVEAEPGHAVEVRIPPYSAVQCVAGSKHTRGTPANVVEMSADALFQLVSGELSWAELLEVGALTATGDRSDLSALFEKIRAE